MVAVGRRDFIKRAGAVGGGALFMAPLTNFAARAAAGDLKKGQGYGPLVPMGELASPICSRLGQTRRRRGGEGAAPLSRLEVVSRDGGI